MITRGIKAACAALCCCLLLSVCKVGAARDDIAERVFRLHVMAASDSEEDQALKLKVRDRLLRETDGLLCGIVDRGLAIELVRESLPRLQAAATDCLREAGCNDTVSVSIGQARFPQKQYDDVTLPAGEYEALCVVIGEGQGQNWWCVVFPPMCLSGVGERDTAEVLTDYEQTLVKQPERYRVRLKFVEWLDGMFDWF